MKKQQIFLNPKTGLIATTQHRCDASPGWLYIGQGNHKKVINWLVQLQGSMGDLMECDIETLRESWDRHEL